MRRLCTIVFLAALALIPSAGASAGQYPPDAPSVGVSDSTVTPGQPITVTGDRWEGGATIQLSFHSAVVALGSVTARPDGSFSTSVTIPSSATPGTHQIMASGTASNGRDRTVSTDVTVLGDVVTAPGSTAFTGAHLDVWMIGALVLLVIGIGLVVLGRRRARPSAR